MLGVLSAKIVNDSNLLARELELGDYNVVSATLLVCLCSSTLVIKDNLSK